MSTTYNIIKKDHTELEITEQSTSYTFSLSCRKEEIDDAGEILYLNSTTRFSSEELLEAIVNLARAASYQADDPDQFIDELLERIPY